MTTVAFRNGVLAADTQITCEDGSKTRAHKIRRLPDGSCFACAGDSSAQILRLTRWMEKGMPARSRPRVPKEDQIDVLLVKLDGSAWMINEMSEFERVEVEFMAIGTGAGYALGAMACGRTALQAVKVAAKFDANTSGPFDTAVPNPEPPTPLAAAA